MGFAATEIPQYFSQYEGSIPTAASYDMNIAKVELFVGCVQGLKPENQRHALYDLCDDPPGARYPMPKEAIRRSLLTALVQADGRSPLSTELSSVTLSGVREQWFRAASRLLDSPASAITAARTLLESTCNTILVEQGEPADSTGDLTKLYKRVRICLGIDPRRGASQNLNQLVRGLSQLVDGLAGLSNLAGDRHGLPSGTKITDLSYAGLAVHAAGSAALFLVRIHQTLLRGPQQ
jgi:hypothetical protein